MPIYPSKYDWSGERARRRQRISLILKTSITIVFLVAVGSVGILFIR